jgi:hypothetical protein
MASTNRSLLAVLFLLLVLSILFAPALFGGKTFLLSSWDTASITASGAYDQAGRPPLRLARTPDPGAPAWISEPWFSVISDQLWREFNWPLWNPYNGYGTPLAAAMQPQPFYPLSILLSLHLTAWTYNVFIVARIFLAALLTYFFTRQFLSALPSLFSALAFALTGYFIIYLNMPHVSVEILIPGILLSFERLLRSDSWLAVAGAAAMIFLAMVGGMPESAFLVISFAIVYFLCRLFFASEYRRNAAQRLGKFAIAVALGFALSAFLLLPFLEFLSLGHDVHQPSNISGARSGLAFDHDGRSVVMYLLPLIFGPVLNLTLSNFSGWSGLRGYWGIIAFFFAVAALISLFANRRARDIAPERFLVLFFCLMLLLMTLKRFGNPVIHWIGYLPLSDMIVYPKYQEPLIAFCVAMLAGLGFSALVGGRIVSRDLAWTAGVVGSAMLLLAVSYIPDLASPSAKYANVFFFGSLGAGMLVLFVAALVSWLALRNSSNRRTWLLRGLVVFLVLELSFNFIVPGFYVLNKLPPAKASAYAGAPYVDFLRSRNADHSRVFGRENILYPNWSAAFKLEDVRSLDALLYTRYRTFIRSFLLAPGDDGRVHGDLADRFTGGDFPYAFGSQIERRFLALSSIRYLITDSDYGAPSAVVDEIIRQHSGEFIWGFGADVFRIGGPAGSKLRGVAQHAPSTKVAFKTVVDARAPIFEGFAVIKENPAEPTDGAGFTVELRAKGATETLVRVFLDPRSAPADWAGRAIRTDLTRHAGEEVELVFSTDPGPRGDRTGDWAGWAGLRFVAKDAAPARSEFSKIYDEEVRIYEVPSVLPRAALYRAIEVLPDGEVLRRLKEATFNPLVAAIVSQESLSAPDQNALRSLSNGASGHAAPATISRYDSQRVSVEAETDVPALLVLNDANYPGWKAYVNGEPAPMVTANYLFRGVFVPAGRSTVEFRYQPASFRAGGAISIAALAILAALMLHAWRKRRRVQRSA